MCPAVAAQGMAGKGAPASCLGNPAGERDAQATPARGAPVPWCACEQDKEEGPRGGGGGAAGRDCITVSS